MVARVEFIDADYAHWQFATSPELTEEFNEEPSERPGLILWYDEAIVLSGSVDSIRALLQSGLRVLDEGEKRLAENSEAG